MAANLRYQLEGEQNRVHILNCLKGKELSAIEIAFATGMTKQKVENYLRSLMHTGHIVNHKQVKNKFVYKRTTMKFVTMAMQDQQLEESYEEEIPVQVISPHARVVKLLDRKQQPQPKSKKRKEHMYGGMQSSMQSFGSW